MGESLVTSSSLFLTYTQDNCKILDRLEIRLLSAACESRFSDPGTL